MLRLGVWTVTLPAPARMQAFLAEAADEERVRKKLTDATGGRCTIEEGGRPVLGEQSGKYMVLS